MKSKEERIVIAFSGTSLFVLMFLAAVCLSSVLVASVPSAAAAESSSLVHTGDRYRGKEVLILNSYHAGYAWSDETLAGVLDELKVFLPPENIHVEYMDTKRHLISKYQEQLLGFYQRKYEHNHFDVVVTVDDTAFEFARRNRAGIFGNSPIVFAGIATFDDAAVKEQGITGVLEKIEVEATIDLALRLRPLTRNLYLVLDASEAAAAWRPLMEAAASKRPGVAVHWLDGRELSTAEMLAQVGEIPAEATIVAGIWNRDRNGHFVAVDEVARAVCSRAAAPVFALSRQWVRNGAVGGKVPDPQRHGRKVGELVSKLLAGAPVETIAITGDCACQYVFNHETLAGFAIKKADLPADSLLLNPPEPSLYRAYPTAFWTGVLVIVTLSGLLVALSLNRRRLREREGHYHSLYTNNKAVILLIRPEDGAILDANAAASEFYGWTREQLMSRMIGDIDTLPPEALRSAIEQSLREECHHFFVQHRLADGTVRDVEILSGPFFSQGRKLIYSIIHDISDRKRAEDQLRKSEARYRQLFEANPLPMWIFDQETLRFLAVNDSAIANYGYSREEFLAMSLKDIRPPEDLPAFYACIANVTSRNEQFLTRHRSRDGRLIEVEVHAHEIDFDGRSARVALIHDVTEKMRAEERMQLDAAALMSTRDAVMIIDRNPRILSVNPAFTRITGYDPGEIVGGHPRILGSSRHNRTFFRKMWAELVQENYWQGEVWGRRKDGVNYPGWLTVSAVQNHGTPTHFVGVMTDLTKLKASEERLKYLASYDPLTGLPNRQMLETVLQHAIERARRERQGLALLVLDLDQFKSINDSFGHRTGDEVLVAVVDRLRGRVRREDTLSRLAGDQFALVMERMHDYADVEILARDLQSTLDPPFVPADGKQIFLRTSIGISLYPQDGVTAEDLLRGADAAVHLAKERGGNLYCYCTAELNAHARQRLELESELRMALERGEFLPYYQPKVDLRSGRIVGAEALLRWRHPSKGIIQPNQFIQVAEKNGLIVPIGAWVIEEVCRQIREWGEAGLADIGVAVNVSARQFRSGNLDELISAALQRHGVQPQLLTIELTESMLMDDPEGAVERISGLRRIGVGLSLDDFGTGYSSLGYLSRFPIDQLKIDRSFISDIGSDSNAAAIAISIIALAHRMRLEVVAEGVETEAQLGYLRQNNCDQMQGFYFSKPVPANEFAALLREGKALHIEETQTRGASSDSVMASSGGSIL